MLHFQEVYQNAEKISNVIILKEKIYSIQLTSRTLFRVLNVQNLELPSDYKVKISVEPESPH